MRFLVDNSLSPCLTAWLCDAGHDAVHVRDLGLAETDDETILDTAAQQDRVLIVQDADFAAILAMRRQDRPSILLFRTWAKSTEAIRAILSANLEMIRPEAEAGAVIVFEEARIRVRKLPISGES